METKAEHNDENLNEPRLDILIDGKVAFSFNKKNMQDAVSKYGKVAVNDMMARFTGSFLATWT